MFGFDHFPRFLAETEHFEQKSQKRELIAMSYLPKETLCFWSLPKISDRIYDIWSKIDGIHSRHEKSIWSLLVELWMIYDCVNIDNVRSSLQLLCILFWGSGRAARQDDYIWINTTIFEYSETSFEYCYYEGPGEQPGRTTLNEITQDDTVATSLERE